MTITVDRQGDRVERLRIETKHHATPEDPPTTLWQLYDARSVLDQLGTPSQVHLNFTIGAPCAGSGSFPDYHMWMLYQDQGIALRYSGLLLRDNLDWVLCLWYGQTPKLKLVLQSPTATAELIDPEAEVYDTSGYWSVFGPLEELTGMDTAAFRQELASEPQTCIVVLDSQERVGVLTTPSRTLSPAEEETLLDDLLAADDACQPPCWWGITPGVTPWAEAEERFLSYGRSIYSIEGSAWGTRHRLSLVARHDPHPYEYFVEHILYEQEGIVSLIGVHVHAPGWPAPAWSPSQRMAADWQDYALDRVLARMGPPSQVLLHYWGDHISPYSVALLYQEQGVLVEYMGLIQGEKTEDEYYYDPVVICPATDPLTDVNLWFQPPGADTPLPEVFSEFGGGYLELLPYQTTPTLKEAAGMSMDTFTQTYLDPGAQLCLEVSGLLGDWMQ